MVMSIMTDSQNCEQEEKYQKNDFCDNSRQLNEHKKAEYGRNNRDGQECKNPEP